MTLTPAVRAPHPSAFLSALVAMSAVFSFASPSYAADAKKTETTTKVETKTEKTDTKGDKKVTNPKVEVQTSLGNFEIELNPEKAPISVANFLKYVDKGFYNGTIFHRVISTFMIQGGGFTEDMNQKSTDAPIKNEATNGLANDKYTVAMARTQVTDSATSQFFVNVTDNSFLNYKDPKNYGYAVFGKVTKGMDVVDKIKAVPTGVSHGMGDVPKTAVVIKSIKKLD